MLTSIVAAVVILGLLVLVHESGHFLMAKRCGIKVIRFSIGYPPKVLGIRRGGTEYAIGATPFGGYVRMLGDEIGDEPGAQPSQALLAEYLRDLGADIVVAAAQAGRIEPRKSDSQELALLTLANSTVSGEGLPAAAGALGRQPTREEALLLDQIKRDGSLDEAIKHLSEEPPKFLLTHIHQQSFPTQPLWKRLLVVLAGPMANIAFAPVLLSIVFLYGVPRLLPILGQVKANFPAQSAGLHQGDKIIAINGHPIATWDDLSNQVRHSKGQPLQVEFDRASNHQSLTITPIRDGEKPADKTAPKAAADTDSEQWVIGVLPRGDSIAHREGPLSAVSDAFVETGKMSVMLVVGIAKIVNGSTPVRQALGGPIMIAQLAGKEAHEGFASVALFTVMLSIELGIINLLPVPMLDGGHLLFFVIEGLRGKPLQVRHREIAQQVGLFLLAVLMAFVIFNDISHIVQG